MQIIVVKGTFPPLQRNIAIEKATGQYIFLFDDDVLVPPGAMEKVLEDFAKNQDVDVIGGPNLTPPNNGFLQHCFGLAHSSYFTGASTATRYFPARNLKNISESNLISCNLAFRTNTLKENPFDPVVFPNEENELLGRLQRLNHKLSYNPDFFVYHHRRKTLSGYVKQIFNWGAGRTVHSLTRPAHFNPVFLVPLAFLLYLVSLAFFRPLWYMMPLILYIVLDIGFSFFAALRAHQNSDSAHRPTGAKSCTLSFFPVMLLLFPLTHIIYALGLVWGLVRHFGRARVVPAKESFQTIEIIIN